MCRGALVLQSVTPGGLPPCAEPVQLGAAVVVGFKWLVLTNWTTGTNAGSGIQMLVAAESGEPGMQLVEEAAMTIRWCFPRNVFLAATVATPRADGSPAAQVFELLARLPPELVSGAAALAAPGAGGSNATGTNGSTAGSAPTAGTCVNGTQGSGSNSTSGGSVVPAVTAAAPPLDRCYALIGLFVDYLGSAYMRSSSGRLEKAGFGMQYKRAVWLCEGVVDDECIKSYGPVGCLYNYFGVGLQTNASGSAAQPRAAGAGAPSSAPAPPTPPPSSSSVDAGVVAGAVVGSVVGALLLAAAIWAAVVWRRNAHRQRQLEQQRQDSDGGGEFPKISVTQATDLEEQQQHTLQPQQRGLDKGDLESAKLPASVGQSERDASSSQGTGYETTLPPPPSHLQRWPSTSTEQPQQQPQQQQQQQQQQQPRVAHTAELGGELAAAEVVTELTPRRPSVSLVTTTRSSPPPPDASAPGLKSSARLAALTAAFDKAPLPAGRKGSVASRGTASGGVAPGAATSSPAAGSQLALSEQTQQRSQEQPQEQAQAAQEQEPQQGEDRRSAEHAEDATGVAARLNVTLVPNGLLGKGSFGRVYRGRYQGRDVAVKVFSGEFATEGAVNDKEVVDSLCAEVEVLSRVDHPNIVKLLAVCLTPPRFCLVMELMQLNLAQLLHGDIGRVCTCGAQGSGPCSPYCPMSSRVLPLLMVLDIAIDIARALAYLHPTVSHRDLKPANVLLTWSDSGEAPAAASAASACSGGSSAASGGVSRGGRRGKLVAKLSDFGISRMSHTLCATVTPEAGTPAYIAPECFNPANWLVSCKSDMYAYGVLLWELLTGLEPWKGIPVARIAYRVTLLRERLPLELIDLQRPDPVPARLPEIVAACFDEDPQRRPAAAELANELEGIRGAVAEQQRRRLETEAAQRHGGNGPAGGPAGPWG
ncbi:hypothetical protein HXX76_010673 [Chlamydomonas incerta]|uniref:Protein kinase domain-containing protein n=1 Tax=Chlamydomonas incerta TaxID=51695 RepID=A0A835SMN9_CHLIN|nr:hypothetical protein HXX76_010673 [Chlamydomonas incerta]|eukprot:KAG2429893.1 hypothetical protein HXX76_010673 [Chlamydomonas incerta]